MSAFIAKFTRGLEMRSARLSTPRLCASRSFFVQNRQLRTLPASPAASRRQYGAPHIPASPGAASYPNAHFTDGRRVPLPSAGLEPPPGGFRGQEMGAMLELAYGFRDERRQLPRFLRPLLFTLGVAVVSFGAADYITQKQITELADRIQPEGQVPVQDLQRLRRHDEIEAARASVRRVGQRTFPALARVYGQIRQAWLNTTDFYRVSYIITAVNTLVFLAWKVPVVPMRIFMMKHFLHNPLSGKSYTLLTSAFSHNSLWHFAFNMMALQGFVAASSRWIASLDALSPDFRHIEPHARHLTVAVDPIPHALAFFLTAAAVASFGSHAATTLSLRRALAASTTTTSASTFLARRARVVPSLGASGAVYAAVVLNALAYPEDRVALFFALPLAIQHGVLGAVALDVVGLCRGWSTFDHVAHLSGAAFGAAFYAGFPYWRAWRGGVEEGEEGEGGGEKGGWKRWVAF